MITTYTQRKQAKAWLKNYRGKRPVFACVLGFTETGLIPNISAAGATPEDRKYTAIADAEFLATGSNINFPLPPLVAGASPVLISRAVVATQGLPLFIFDAGLAEAFVIAFATGLGLAGTGAFLAGVFTTAFFDAGDGLTTFAALNATTFFVWVADLGVDLTEGLVTGLAATLGVDF